MQTEQMNIPIILVITSKTDSSSDILTGARLRLQYTLRFLQIVISSASFAFVSLAHSNLSLLHTLFRTVLPLGDLPKGPSSSSSVLTAAVRLVA